MKYVWPVIVVVSCGCQGKGREWNCSQDQDQDHFVNVRPTLHAIWNLRKMDVFLITASLILVSAFVVLILIIIMNAIHRRSILKKEMNRGNSNSSYQHRGISFVKASLVGSGSESVCAFQSSNTPSHSSTLATSTITKSSFPVDTQITIAWWMKVVICLLSALKSIFENLSSSSVLISKYSRRRVLLFCDSH